MNSFWVRFPKKIPTGFYQSRWAMKRGCSPTTPETPIESVSGFAACRKACQFRRFITTWKPDAWRFSLMVARNPWSSTPARGCRSLGPSGRCRIFIFGGGSPVGLSQMFTNSSWKDSKASGTSWIAPERRFPPCRKMMRHSVPQPNPLMLRTNPMSHCRRLFPNRELIRGIQNQTVLETHCHSGCVALQSFRRQSCSCGYGARIVKM